jgi:hypothetical protein
MTGIDRLQRDELKLGPGRSGAASVMQLDGDENRNCGYGTERIMDGVGEGSGGWRNQGIRATHFLMA